jgi:hypothetical protein
LVTPRPSGVVLLTATLAGFVVPLDVLRVIVALMLMTLGLYRLWRHRHPRYGGMQVGFRDLTAWSFLMASAHGAGFMVLPFVMPTPDALSAASHVHASHAAAAGATVATTGATAVAVHTLAYLAVIAAAAWIVYRKLGLGVLRKAWFNTDWLWAGGRDGRGGAVQVVTNSVVKERGGVLCVNHGSGSFSSKASRRRTPARVCMRR